MRRQPAVLLMAACMVLAAVLTAVGGPPPSMPPTPPQAWMMPGPGIFPQPPPFGPRAGGAFGPDDGWFLNPYFRLGYQFMNLKVDFPVDSADPATSVKIFEDMHLKLLDRNFLVVFGGAELRVAPSLIFFADAGTNLATGTRRMEMFAVGRGTDAPPALDANLVPPWTWDVDNFLWWQVDAGLAWYFTPRLAVEAGFRLEDKQYKLTNPRNDTERVDVTPPIVPVPGNAITCNRI